MNVHEFRKTLQENKDLYTEEEYSALCDQWLEEYQQYLVNLVKQKKKD